MQSPNQQALTTYYKSWTYDIWNTTTQRRPTIQRGFINQAPAKAFIMPRFFLLSLIVTSLKDFFIFLMMYRLTFCAYLSHPFVNPSLHDISHHTHHVMCVDLKSDQGIRIRMCAFTLIGIIWPVSYSFRTSNASPLMYAQHRWLTQLYDLSKLWIYYTFSPSFECERWFKFWVYTYHSEAFDFGAIKAH
jgi:hypothetical protein